ncbi:hypothetical protein GQ457_05G035020 [Hibiscus cannabinus]
MGSCFSVQLSFDNFIDRGWDSIVRHANYVCKLKQTLPTLSAALEELRVQKNDVQREVDLAEQRQLKRLEQVQLWLSNAETMITEADNLIADSPREINNLCLGGCASKTCLSSYKFGKKVAKMDRDIKDHMSKGAFEKVAESQPAASVVVRPEEQPIALESMIDKVWSCIMDKDVGIIGLYGLGGAGKTTLLTQINNKFSTTPNDFDVVIWALVSKDYNVGKIQDEIGGIIGISSEDWKYKTVEQKAVDINGVLRGKRFVVLLDDLWKRVDLIKVGIPKPNQENGSKIIFTTRSSDICGEMEARKKIKVKCLELEDAWKLFQDKVGDEALNSHPDIPKLAKQVAEECDGLPLALITIGRAMANKTTPVEWKYAIEKLKRSSLPKMKDEVYPLLKFSYDNLPPTIKCCLLYCCLYPEDYEIPKRRLVDYWFCEGLLNEFDRISEAEMQGDHIINSLLSACLLERAGESSHEECVKMHDVIRDMCLWIACELGAKEKKFFVKAGAQLAKEPSVKAWEGAKRMSLMQNRIEVLKTKPKCPNLQTLLLRQNNLKRMSDGFFQFIPNLTVLDLSDNGLEALPMGISQLVSLKCLDLSKNFIKELPIELKSLTKLKMLDLSHMYWLIKIPQYLISSFSKLQIFRFWNRPQDYFPKEDNVLDGDDNEKLIEELISLQHLNIVRIPPIQSISVLKRSLSLHLHRCYTETLELRGFIESSVFNVLYLESMERLERLEIIGCENMEMRIEKLHTKVSPSTNGSSRFHTLREVSISGCFKLKDLTWLILVPNLRTLRIVWCVEMEEIASEGKLGEVTDVVEIPYSTPFLKLETLELYRLRELKSIYWDALPFPCLKSISIEDCPKLKKLPLNSDSAEENHITIKGSQNWWAELEWENEATRHAFLPSFHDSKF